MLPYPRYDRVTRRRERVTGFGCGSFMMRSASFSTNSWNACAIGDRRLPLRWTMYHSFMIGKPSTLRMATRPSVSESRLGAVLAEVDKLMKRGHRLVAFVSDTQVMRREKFDERGASNHLLR